MMNMHHFFLLFWSIIFLQEFIYAPDSNLKETADKAPSAEKEEQQQKDVEKENVRECIDEIVAIIYGSERTRVLCRSELVRLSIDGMPRTFRGIVIEELVYQDALRNHMPIDDAAVDKYIAGIRQQYGLSEEGIAQIFLQSGYTYQEGREQLRLVYAVNGMTEYKITSHLIITREEVVDYYNAHPIIEEKKYNIEKAFIPFNLYEEPTIQKDALVHAVKQGNADQFEWISLGWLKDTDLLAHLRFIVDMQPGDLTMPQETDGGFELYRLAAKSEKKQVSLEARYKEIEHELRRPKLEKMKVQYENTVLASAQIICFDKALKETLYQDTLSLTQMS